MRPPLLAILVIALAQAQEYDVVSVKPGDPDFHGSSARSTPGSMEMRNTTLITLVRSAYDLNEFQVSGGPKWADTERFIVNVKYPPTSTREQRDQMMRRMLADRFKLEFHRETRTLSEYVLVVGKGGPKLVTTKEDEPGRGGTSQGPRMIKAAGLRVERLAQMLISVVEAPVIDKTGLTGEYTVNLRFAPLNAGQEETLPSIFTVIQELGLKLEPIKGPVEVLVIDKAEFPAAN
jgi:uncharacterized protein (TIGR03435 family)